MTIAGAGPGYHCSWQSVFFSRPALRKASQITGWRMSVSPDSHFAEILFSLRHGRTRRLQVYARSCLALYWRLSASFLRFCIPEYPLPDPAVCGTSFHCRPSEHIVHWTKVVVSTGCLCRLDMRGCQPGLRHETCSDSHGRQLWYLGPMAPPRAGIDNTGIMVTRSE